MKKEMEVLQLVIVVSNFTSQNPLAEKRTPFAGTWAEGVEKVKELRAANPTYYVGLKWPC